MATSYLISEHPFGKRQLQLDFCSSLLFTPLASPSYTLFPKNRSYFNKTLSHRCYPLKIFLHLLTPWKCGSHHRFHSTNSPIQSGCFLHYVLMLLSKGFQNICNCQTSKLFLVESIDHQPAFLEMPPLVTVVCSTSSSQTSLSFFFYCLLFPKHRYSPKPLRSPTFNPLMITSFHITLASTQVICNFLKLIPSPLPSFGHWLPTTN